jgi:amidohydrolase
MINVNKEDFKKRVTEEINNYKDKLQELALKLLACPELGFKEQKTAGYLKEELEKLGLIIDDPVALTGFKGSFKTGKKGPKVAILGELDSIICYKHPRADRSTGAAQACGHYAQLVSLLGVAAGLKKSGVLDKLAGEVVFMAVPAEEYIDLEFREKLIDDGVIKYKSGKQQAIWEGHFDDINIALMSHILPDEYLFKVYAGMKSNTFVSKSVTFIGKESHAGATPHLGINALNMAVLALNNINAQRETFPEEDKVRIHSIITNCGDAVNVIPGEVTMETKVRGASLDIMKRAAEKVDRCLHAASYAVGGNVIIKITSDSQDITGTA